MVTTISLPRTSLCRAHFHATEAYNCFHAFGAHMAINVKGSWLLLISTFTPYPRVDALSDSPRLLYANDEEDVSVSEMCARTNNVGWFGSALVSLIGSLCSYLLGLFQTRSFFTSFGVYEGQCLTRFYGIWKYENTRGEFGKAPAKTRHVPTLMAN